MIPENNLPPRPQKVLWVRLRGCHPLNYGGAIYSYHLMVQLMKSCEVHVLELHHSGETCDAAGPPYAHKLERYFSKLLPDWSPRRFFSYIGPILLNLFASRESFVLSAFHRPGFSRHVREVVTQGNYDLVIADGLMIATAFEGWAEERTTRAILLQHNVEANIWKGLTRLQRNPFTLLFYHEMTRRLQRREPEICAIFDGVTTISEPDADFHRQVYGLGNILGAVPPGTGISSGSLPVAVVRQDEAPCLAFVGAMNWPPNVDGAHWFIKEVLPLIWRTMPGVRFRIIGREPPESLHRIAAAESRIEVTGTVPDVQPLLQECALQVVPLRAGSGVRHKILESMAAGVPVVSTKLGAEGLDLRDGHEALLADDATALSAAIVRMLQDSGLRIQMAVNARERASADFSWAQSAARLLWLCSQLPRQSCSSSSNKFSARA